MHIGPSVSSSHQVIDHFKFADLVLNGETGQKSLHCALELHKEYVITSFSAAAILQVPSRYTVQAGDNHHILLHPQFLQYINHSCSPNVYFDVHTMQLISLQHIMPSDEFTFFYPSTEWDMVEPFHCKCGSVDCLNLIKGAKYLSSPQIQQYRVNQYISNKHHRQLP